MQQKIVSLDSTILNTLQSCAKKVDFAFVQNLKPVFKAGALEAGDLMHKMLECYYSLKGHCASFDSEVWKTLSEADLIPTFYGENQELEQIVEFCVNVGRFYGAKMNASVEDLEEVIYQFTEYVGFYKYEEWHALAVESVGAKLLFEDESWKIIYNCKTDIVAEKGSLIAPWDHKTSKRRQTPRALSNQFRGTCFVLDKTKIMINKIGFQKTLAPNERFQRFLLEIPQTIIAEWQTDTIYWAKMLHSYIESGFWPRNLTSCDKYSGCVYAPICDKAPENRLYEIEKNFVCEAEWDVAKVLEDV
jgi:hypothetical protein